MKVSTFALTAAVTLIASSSSADTVAWWHFDDAEPGTTANSGVVTESVSGSTATSYYLWSNQVQQANSVYRPAFGPTLGFSVYDPVSGATNTNRSAMKFVTARGGATPDTDAGRAYYGGALKVDGGDTLYSDCTDSVTIETFVCTTGGVYNTFAPIIGCLVGTSWTSEKWAIYMENDGTIAVRFNGAVWYSGNGTPKNTGTLKINDGLWHHVAITWDGNTVRTYVDYTLDKRASDKADREYAKTGTVSYSGTATWIGGYAQHDPNSGGRKFPGLIDEVRVSSGALSPDQFLRLVSTTVDDMVLHLRFDSDVARAIEDGEVVADSTGGGVQAVYHSVAGANPSTYDTVEKAGAAVADGLYDDAPVADTASFCQFTNAADNANYIKAEAATACLFRDGTSNTTNHNYTVEAFFKANGEGQIRKTLLKLGSKHLPAHFITGESAKAHQIQFCYRKDAALTWTSGGYTPGDKPYDDGNWHHVAFVSDASNKTVRAYYDYLLVAEAANVYVPVPWNEPLVIGSQENGTAQFFDGWIDDVRVTRRALSPDEFLTTRPVGSGPATLFFAGLENGYNFTFSGDDGWSVDGRGRANTSAGNVPTFEKVSPGDLLLDGANGTVRTSNDYSVRLNKSYIEFPTSPLYEQRAFTVEFWAKFTGYVDGGGEHDGAYANLSYHAGILRFNRATGSEFDWFFYRQNRNAKGTQVAVRNADGTVQYCNFPFDRYIADGKWHHYAITFETNEANTETTVSVYDDRKLVASQTCAGVYQYYGGHKLQFAMGSSNPPFTLGYVNSVRFSRGVLAPDKFMGRVKSGVILIIK